METFASTNGDTKSIFLKIYLNELISLKYRGEKMWENTFTERGFIWCTGVQVKTSFVITSIQMVNI